MANRENVIGSQMGFQIQDHHQSNKVQLLIGSPIAKAR